VVDAMLAAASAPGANQAIINVGSGKDISVRELVHLVLEVTGGKPEIVYSPRNERGPARMCADLTLARQKLKYMPLTSLKEGLGLTLERDPRLRQK
jgi:nucleoside-diphosphate-sugar epimerase